MKKTNLVLDKLVLFAAATRIVGVEREAGAEAYGKSRKQKFIQSVINPKNLSGFNRLLKNSSDLLHAVG